MQPPTEARKFGEVQFDSVLADLEYAVMDFIALEESDAADAALYCEVASNVYRICALIARCEQENRTREEIVRILEPVRRIHRRSDFVRRLQDWPRGYPGDFETIEYLCSGASTARPGTLEDMCERLSLSRAIAQQHRNKVQQQSARIMQTMLQRPRESRIFSIASGSCPDFRAVAPHLPALAGEIWLNDSDLEAIEFSAGALYEIRDRLHFRPGNALKVARRAVQEQQRFDLVLAGGLFDYLPDRHASYLIEQAWSLLAPGGVFFWTNIAKGNPYRVLIEYFAEWFLIERSAVDVIGLCNAANVAGDALTLRRDETDLTWIVEIHKPS